MPTTRELAKHFATNKFENIDDETIRRTKRKFLDTIGVMIAGSQDEDCKLALKYLSDRGGAETATVVVSGAKLPASSAAFVNSLQARAFDFGPVDVNLTDGGFKAAHLYECLAPATLAACQATSEPPTGKEVLCALATADDFGARVVEATSTGPEDGYDGSGIVSGMVAATAAGMLYKLDEDAFVNALGLMANSLSGSMAVVDESSAAFKYPVANASQNAIFTVELAKAGYGCVKDPIFTSKGYFDIYGGRYNLDHFMDGFGTTYQGTVVIKPWPACRITHPAIEATLRAVDNKPIEDVDAIESINIWLSPKGPDFVMAPFDFGETNRYYGLFNDRYPVAMAILCGELRPEQHAAEYKLDPRLEHLLGCQTYALDETFPEKTCAKCVIKMKDGSELVGEVPSIALGHFDRSPLSDDQIMDKFLHNAAYGGMPEEQALKIADFILHLDEKESMDELFELIKL